MTRQEQIGGSGSTNIQVGNITTGLTYGDVREIATEIFDRNFANLTSVAREIAERRAEEIREDLIEKMKSDPKASTQSFAQVEKQVHLFEAQKAYAVSGDKELKRLLVAALTDVSSAPERSIKSIVLGEAIKIAALLTPVHLRALSVGFCVWHVSFRVASLKDLFSNYIAAADLHISNLALTPGDIRHLEYLGCGISGTHNLPFDTLLREEYPGLIQLGFEPGGLADLFAPLAVPSSLLTPSLRFPERREFAMLRLQDIRDSGAGADLITKCESLFKMYLLNNIVIEKEIVNLGADEARFFHLWRSSQLENFKLTSAGIAIGYMFASERMSLPDIEVFL